jgi:predicted phage replisome organizer
MKVSWLKLDIDILNDSKMKIIRKYPDGDALFVLWVGLLCLAMKSDNSGFIYVTHGFPFTAEDLSTELNLEVKTVEMGLLLFRKLGMIDISEGGMIEIINFNKHQSHDKIESIRIQNRERQKKHRESKLLYIEDNANRNVTVTLHNATDKIRLDKIRLDKNLINIRGEKSWRDEL